MAAAAGISAIDTVWSALDDQEGFETEVRNARALGFSGKSCIHPSQIPVVNEMLRVSSRDYADARSILNWDKDGLVAASRDGDRMNEYNTHYNWARRIVLRAERYGTKP